MGGDELAVVTRRDIATAVVAIEAMVIADQDYCPGKSDKLSKPDIILPRGADGRAAGAPEVAALRLVRPAPGVVAGEADVFSSEQGYA